MLFQGRALKLLVRTRKSLLVGHKELIKARRLSGIGGYKELSVFEKQQVIEDEILPLMRDETHVPHFATVLTKKFRVSGGTAAALAMRDDIENIYKKKWHGQWTLLELSRHEYVQIDSFLKHWLMAVFNFDTIRMERITFDSPATTLEVVSRSETVHKVSSLYELKKRLKNSRRCYGLFHDQLQLKPLAFIHIALTNGMAFSMRSLYTLRSEERPTHVMFYSINSCVHALRGVGIGRLLIMRVAQELAQQFPSAHTFSTLSPVPRFTKWLRKAAVQLQESEDAVAKLLAEAVENETDVIDTRGDRHRHSHDRQDQAPEVASALSHSNTHSHAQGGSRGGHAPFLIPAEYLEQLKLAAGHDLATRASISEIDSWAGKPVTAAEALTWLVDKLEGFDDDKNNWVEDLVVSGLIKEPLMWLVSHHIATSKITRADPVSQFHLSNGAEFHSVRWLADPSLEGLLASAGLMVNYLYDLEKVNENAARYKREPDFLPMGSSVRHILQVKATDVEKH